MDAREAETMIEAAERAGLPLLMAYYCRALPRFEALRACIAAGRLGEVRAVTMRQLRPGHYAPGQAWKLDPTINGGGLFVDIQVHTLDWLAHCFGPPADVRGLVRRRGDGLSEDLVAFTLGWRAGMVANGLYGFGAGPEDEWVAIHGSEATATMSFVKDDGFTLTFADGRAERVTHRDDAHERRLSAFKSRLASQIGTTTTAPTRT